MKITGTGHRPNKFGNDYSLQFKDWGPWKLWIYRELVAYIYVHKPTEIISGLALGFDQILAVTAMRMDIPLTAAIPCKGQEKVWPPKSQAFYHFLLEYASKTHYISDTYTLQCMDDRNKWMVNQLIPGDLLIGLHDGTPGGTNNCLKYARKQLNPEQIIIINPKDYYEEKY